MPNFKVRVDLEVPEGDVAAVAGYATVYCGYRRENPRKPWSAKEYKEAIKAIAQKAVADVIAREQARRGLNPQPTETERCDTD